MKRRKPLALDAAPALDLFEPPPASLPPAPAAAATVAPPQPGSGDEAATEALRSSSPELPLAVRELLGFPAALITTLPLPTTLVCRRRDGLGAHGGLVLITTLRAAYQLARRAGVPALTGRELLALALGVEADRVTAAIAARWWAAKEADPTIANLTPELTLGGVDPEPRAAGDHGAVLEQVLHAAGLQLLSATAGDELPAELSPAGDPRPGGGTVRAPTPEGGAA